MTRPIGNDEFGRLLAGFRRTAFHMETRPFYVIPSEQPVLERFLTGTPEQPPDVGWWREWLSQVDSLTRQGKHVGRVRVLDEPPTDYQRWLLWAGPWHAAAGEDIRYIPRRRAGQAGLPLDHDWWLLDDEQVIRTRFTPGNAAREKTLITDPEAVAAYLAWRDTAVRYATAAEQIAAA